MATKHFLGGRIILGTEFVGYKFKFFEPGTSTPKTTYKDSSLTVGNENAHPVVLDTNGAAQIWFDGNADVVFYTSADVVVYSDDDINVTSSSSSTGSGNFSVNGSFEDDTDADGIPDGWTRTLYTDGAFSLQTTDQFNGQKSVKFTSTGTGGGYITSTDTFAVSPSVIYSIGWAMKGTADVRNVVEVLWYQDDGTASGVTSSTTLYDDSATNPTSWTEKWYEATSPSDAAFAKLRLTGCHSSDATSGNTAYDSVVFTDLVHKRSPNTINGVTTISGKSFNLAKGTSIAAAGTMNIWGTDGNLYHMTGAGTVLSFGTAPQAGARRKVIIDGTVVIVPDGTRIFTEGTTTLTSAPNDFFDIFADTTTKHYIKYNKFSGQPVASSEYPLTYGTVAVSTSGTAVEFTGLSASSVKFVLFNLAGISTSGNDALRFQIGGTGGYGTSGYLGGIAVLFNGSSVAANALDSSFALEASGGATRVRHGLFILSLLDSSTNTWTAKWTIGLEGAGAVTGAGSISLASALDRMRLISSGGTDTFDAGKAVYVIKT